MSCIAQTHYCLFFPIQAAAATNGNTPSARKRGSSSLNQRLLMGRQVGNRFKQDRTDNE
jgi:hypothetical protein